jgi:hypothetical protein
MALSDTLHDLERTAQSNGAAYRQLQRGLGVKVSLTVDAGVYQCSIARQAPSVPSVGEERTVANALAPAFVGDWVRRTNVLGKDGKRYNISTVEYTRTQGVG